MSDPRHTSRPVTPKQRRFLRDLAMERGESFTYPASFEDADREIKRLLGRERQSRGRRRREARELSREMAERRGDAVAVRLDLEAKGYGSTATWR